MNKPPQEPPMNTTTTLTPSQHLAACALAVLMTVGTLGAMELLATGEPSAAQLARAEALAAARS